MSGGNYPPKHYLELVKAVLFLQWSIEWLQAMVICNHQLLMFTGQQKQLRKK